MRISLLLFITASSLFAQTDYQFEFFGPKKDSVIFDTTLNWYYYNNHDGQLNIKKIDLRKDITQTRKIDYDTFYYFQLALDSSLFFSEKSFLLGRKDTIKQISHYISYKDFTSTIGFSTQLKPWTFRSTSPYLSFAITGSSEIQNSTLVTKGFTFNAICDFDEFAYYDAYSYGGKRFEQSEDFTQNLNNLILESDSTNLEDLNILYIGFIDNDGIYDIILNRWNKYHLLLSYNHDIDNKVIYYLARSWIDENHYTFEF